jgi:hypothetical protein
MACNAYFLEETGAGGNHTPQRFQREARSNVNSFAGMRSWYQWEEIVLPDFDNS